MSEIIKPSCFARFSSVLKTSSKEVEGKELAIASFDDLKKLAPIYDSGDEFQDLLPVAGNACVINYANYRDDIVDSDWAIRIYKGFVNKFMDVEHDRKIIVGHWTSSFFTKFHPEYRFGKGSEPLSEEEAKNTDEPFNIALGGYVYSVAYPGIARKIIDSSDADNSDYMSISISWELGFDGYYIALGDGSRFLKDCEIITDPDLIAAYAKYHTAYGGRGQLPDGRRVYRLLNNGVLPFGAGLTYTPAGQVQGIAIPSDWLGIESSNSSETEASIILSSQSDVARVKSDEVISDEALVNIAKVEDNEKNLKNISQASNIDVRLNSNMKNLSTLQEICALTDETVKEVSLANIRSVIEDAMSQAATAHKLEIDSKEQARKDAENKAELALASVTSLNEKVAQLEAAEKAREAGEKFQLRMSALDETFDLNAPQREAIASQIRELDDTRFDSWQKTQQVFLVKKAPTKNQTVASTDAPVLPVVAAVAAKQEVASAKEVTAAAVASAIPSQQAVASASAGNADTSKGLNEALKLAFSLGDDGGISIVTNKRSHR